MSRLKARQFLAEGARLAITGTNAGAFTVGSEFIIDGGMSTL